MPSNACQVMHASKASEQYTEWYCRYTEGERHTGGLEEKSARRKKITTTIEEWRKKL